MKQGLKDCCRRHKCIISQAEVLYSLTQQIDIFVDGIFESNNVINYYVFVTSYQHMFPVVGHQRDFTLNLQKLCNTKELFCCCVLRKKNLVLSINYFPKDFSLTECVAFKCVGEHHQWRKSYLCLLQHVYFLFIHN